MKLLWIELVVDNDNVYKVAEVGADGYIVAEFERYVADRIKIHTLRYIARHTGGTRNSVFSIINAILAEQEN